MCRYCKHLKELKNQDKQFYVSLIKSWQRTYVRQEKLLKYCIWFLKNKDCDTKYIRQILIDEIEKELNKECV